MCRFNDLADWRISCISNQEFRSTASGEMVVALRIAIGTLAGILLAVPAMATPSKVADDVDIWLNNGNCWDNECHFSTAYSAFDGSSRQVNVIATAWSITGGNGFTEGNHLRADINDYQYGLGATNTGESNTSPSHTVDNEGRREYVAFQFSSHVTAESVRLALYNGQNGVADADMTIIVGNISNPLDNYINPLAALTDYQSGFSLANDYEGGEYNNRRRGDFASWITKDGFEFGAAEAGNVVIVGADLFTAGSYVDMFKIKKLALDIYETPFTPPSDSIPAPGMLALLGAGLFGLGIRQRKRRTA